MTEDINKAGEPGRGTYSRASLYHVYRWCAYAWVSQVLALVLRRDPMSIFWAIGGACAIGGLFFAFVGIALSVLGFAVPQGLPRRAFVAPLLVSLPPLLYPLWNLING